MTQDDFKKGVASIIKTEMCVGTIATFHERVIAKLTEMLWPEIDHMQTVINTLNKNLEDANDHVLSCFSQGAHIRPDYANKPDHWVYDHMCLSAYESAQDYLIEQGLIKKEECTRG